LEILDYSESLIRIMKYKKLCHSALLDKDWDRAAFCSDEILLAAVHIRRFCAAQKDLNRTDQ
jgi:hypothetical protein